MDYYFRFGVIWSNFDKLLFGLALGLALAFVAIFAGIAIGLVCAFASTSRNPLIRSAVGVYVSVIRNTPILVIVLLVFFALPQFGEVEQLQGCVVKDTCPGNGFGSIACEFVIGVIEEAIHQRN